MGFHGVQKLSEQEIDATAVMATNGARGLFGDTPSCIFLFLFELRLWPTYLVIGEADLHSISNGVGVRRDCLVVEITGNMDTPPVVTMGT